MLAGVFLHKHMESTALWSLLVGGVVGRWELIRPPLPPSLFSASVCRCLTGLTTMATCASLSSFWALAPSISSKTTTTCPTLSTKCATWPSSCARLSSVSALGLGALGAAPPSAGPLLCPFTLVEPLRCQPDYLQFFYSLSRDSSFT